MHTPTLGGLLTDDNERCVSPWGHLLWPFFADICSACLDPSSLPASVVYVILCQVPGSAVVMPEWPHLLLVDWCLLSCSLTFHMESFFPKNVSFCEVFLVKFNKHKHIYAKYQRNETRARCANSCDMVRSWRKKTNFDESMNKIKQN